MEAIWSNQHKQSIQLINPTQPNWLWHPSFSFPAVQQSIEVTVVVLLCKECEKYSIKETTLSKHLSKAHRSILVTSPQGSGHCRAHAEDKLLLLQIFLKHYWTISFVLCTVSSGQLLCPDCGNTRTRSETSNWCFWGKLKVGYYLVR